MDQQDTMTTPRDSAAVPNPLQKLRATCDACNQAKVKCSKNKPSCSRCTSHDIPCVYGISRAGKHRRHSRASKPTSTNPLLSPFQHQFIFENLQPLEIPYDENIFPPSPYPYEQTPTSTGYDTPYLASARTSGDYSDFSIDTYNEWSNASYTSNPLEYPITEATSLPQDLYVDQAQTEFRSGSINSTPLSYSMDADVGQIGTSVHYNIDNTPYQSDASGPSSPVSYLTSPITVASPEVFESCNCYQSIFQALQVLHSVTSALSEATIDYALARNKEAITVCSGALECPCSFKSDRTHVMLLASLIAKSISIIRAAHVSSMSGYSPGIDNLDGMGIYGTPVDSRHSRSASLEGCNTDGALMGYGYEQGGSDEALKSQMVLMELTSAENLVYQFVQTFLQPLRIRREQIGVGQDSVLEDDLRTYESLTLHLQTKLGEMTTVLMGGEAQASMI